MSWYLTRHRFFGPVWSTFEGRNPAFTGGSMLEAGAVAPLFTTQNQDGKEIRLSDFLGKKTVVLYFFPKDNTPG